MTLIVGIRCDKSVVLGADGAATLGNFGTHTISQPVSKLRILSGKQVILGVSGPVSFGQLFADRADKACSALQTTTPVELGRKLRDAFLLDAKSAFDIAGLAARFAGSATQTEVMTSTLVAAAPKGEYSLIEFTYQCNPELATDDLPFKAIGSGQNIADPFLAFLRQIFWPSKLPTLSEGRLAVVWTLTHAIRIAPGGISLPIQVATLEQDDKTKQPIARILSEADLKEHREAISHAEDHLRGFLKEAPVLATDAEAAIPRPPDKD